MAWYNFWRKPKPTPTPVPVPTPTPVPVPPSGTIPTKIYGVATETFAEVAKFNALAGKPVNVYSTYRSFFWDANFPTDEGNKVTASGATYMVTWEPWEPNGNAVQPKYALKTIIAGTYDNLIRNWATQIKAWNKPLLLRFAHEMNGDWYPWGKTNGNKSAEYGLAWNHVRSIFDQVGVKNVTWVWCPNVDFDTSIYYPGTSTVDMIALDGYNWDTASPEQVFGPTLDVLKSYQKPIFIGETGCPEYSGKAKWITDFFAMMKKRGLVGFVWFQYNKEQNWRIDSSTAAQNAFKTGVAQF